jgi:2-polyprenyl-3-methyl-5-hydroxy-6-metoxy-1,4-benzoquinol methylase
MICPLCNKETNDILTNKLRKGEELKVYHCRCCDLGFLNDPRTEDEIKAYYKKQYRKEYSPKINAETDAEELFNIYSGFQQERLSLIGPYLGKDKRLLEIGCSAGMFLYHVKEKVKEVVGLDFDKSSAEYTMQKCQCKVYTSELANTPLKKESFDIICAFQVLEHVKSPLEFLLQVKEYLKVDGILYLEVPNLHDVLVSTFDLPYHHQFYFHAAHLLYFSRKSLRGLLAKAGYTGEFHFIQDYNIVNHFNWILNDRPQADCLPGLSRPQFPFRANVNPKIKESMNNFLYKTDMAYKALLAKLELTANLAFIGSRE